MRVFGSAARRETVATSDIDFLVETRDHVSPWFPAGLVQELESLLGRRNGRRTLLAASPADCEGSQAVMKKDPRVCLAHILECAGKIGKNAKKRKKCLPNLTL